jgi:hypothetical protein
MPDDTAGAHEPIDATPRLRRAAHLQLRFYKGMYVMHMERFYELRRQFWDFMARGETKRAEWALKDAQAMASEAHALLRKQQITEQRLLYLPATGDVSAAEPQPPRRPSRPHLRVIAPPPEGDSDA